VIRLRRDGQAIFERKIETAGTIKLDRGQYLADGPLLLLLQWSRRSGSDACPNGGGLVIVKRRLIQTAWRAPR
jgi:hypothetical protein